MRKRLESSFDKIISISELSDADSARRIHTEDIDVLINLNGYFGASRMGIFSMRPAPIQVNFLGFPATLGATYIDYIIADRQVIPSGDKQFYSESVVYLPDSYQVNDANRQIAQHVQTRSDHQLPERAFVFCNFNQSYKFRPAIFDAWMRILGQVQGSVLWLLESNPTATRNLMCEAECRGVSSDRLIFAGHVSAELHLARLSLADLSLDTLPYNAHTTASDALWAGLPLVTCLGSSFPGRVAASLLRAVDLPELITRNFDEYETLAVNLAHQPARLDALRQKLSANRINASLFDTACFRRHIESAYSTMWDIYRHGEPPRSFEVLPS
jgi:protein O-GlcNAc transferase